MAQRKNSVVLSATAISRLQKLVDSGEYCSIDDAANHVVISALASNGVLWAESGSKPGSTRQYSPVLITAEPESSQRETSPPQKTVSPSKPPPLTGL